jgi:uncharacterized protein (TIGR02328 family)
MDEMERRGYNPDHSWRSIDYRGTALDKEDGWVDNDLLQRLLSRSEAGIHIYKEHNEDYYKECVENLCTKGIHIE